VTHESVRGVVTFPVRGGVPQGAGLSAGPGCSRHRPTNRFNNTPGGCAINVSPIGRGTTPNADGGDSVRGGLQTLPGAALQVKPSTEQAPCAPTPVSQRVRVGPVADHCCRRPFAL
jgi:hypothetical protein